MTDANGIPLAVKLSGANRHDMKMFQTTLNALVVPRPKVSSRRPQHLLADKGYDYPELRTSAKRRGYVAHIKRRGDGMPVIAGRRHPARRWVVERSNRWHNLFRRLKIRYDRHEENYLAFVELANALICFRRAVA